MPKFYDCEQRSTEWFQIHAGKITASRMCDLMAYSKAKGKEDVELKTRANYREELIAERLTGMMSKHFVTEEMKRGTEEEDYARSCYEQVRNVMAYQIGFAIHPTMDFCGASPDALIDGEPRIIEIKNLTTTRHLSLFRDRKVPEEYYDQMQWTMLCCEVEEGDFVSCDSRLVQRAPKLELLIIPVRLDEQRIEELEAEARKMNAEIETAIEQLMATA